VVYHIETKLYLQPERQTGRVEIVGLSWLTWARRLEIWLWPSAPEPPEPSGPGVRELRLSRARMAALRRRNVELDRLQRSWRDLVAEPELWDAQDLERRFGKARVRPALRVMLDARARASAALGRARLEVLRATSVRLRAIDRDARRLEAELEQQLERALAASKEALLYQLALAAYAREAREPGAGPGSRPAFRRARQLLRGAAPDAQTRWGLALRRLRAATEAPEARVPLLEALVCPRAAVVRPPRGGKRKPTRAELDRSELLAYQGCLEPVSWPARGEVWLELGEARFLNAEHGRAAAAFANAVRALPDGPRRASALFRQGLAYHLMHREREAARSFDQLLTWIDRQPPGPSGRFAARLREPALQLLGWCFTDTDWDGDTRRDADAGLPRLERFFAGRLELPHVLDVFRRTAELSADVFERLSAIEIGQVVLRRWPLDAIALSVYRSLFEVHRLARDVPKAQLARRQVVAQLGPGSAFRRHHARRADVLASVEELWREALIGLAVQYQQTAIDLRQTALTTGDPARADEARRTYALAAKAYEKYLAHFPRTEHYEDLWRASDSCHRLAGLVPPRPPPPAASASRPQAPASRPASQRPARQPGFEADASTAPGAGRALYLRWGRPALERCALRAGETLRRPSSILLHLHVERSGEVVEAEVKLERDDVPDPDLVACLREEAKRWRIPLDEYSPRRSFLDVLDVLVLAP